MTNGKIMTKAQPNIQTRHRANLGHSAFGIRHFLGLTLLLTGALRAVEPVQLTAYPQKVRTFYLPTDAAVPGALRSNSVPLPVGNITATAHASDGALWLGTTQGLMRLDFSAPERDRRQYLSGQRYLPDDRVEQLAPDDHGG